VFSGDSRRSSRFGLVGVVVVAALAAVIGLTMGEGESSPTLALGLIFGVIGIFVVVLLLLQRGDLGHAAGGAAAARSRAVAEAGRPVEDPTAVSEAELWAALAIAPIDGDAVEAQAETWDAGRRSLKLSAVVFALIFLTVPPAYLLETFVPLLIGVPLIVAAALYGSFRAIAPGGELDRGYERMERAMAPLGLALTARPQGGFAPRGPTMPGFDYRLRGITELSGERHHPALGVASAHKARRLAQVQAQLQSLEVDDPALLAEQLMVLFEGAVAVSMVRGGDPQVARSARDAACVLLRNAGLAVDRDGRDSAR